MAGRLRLVAGALVLLAGATLAVVTLISTAQTTHGFVSYYGAGRAVLEHRFGSWVYDDSAYTAYLQELTASPVRDIFAPNTPAMALVAAPLARLPHRNARGVWLALSLIALFAGLQWLLRDALARGDGLAWLWTVIVLVSPATLANVRTGQAYLLTFAALVFAIHALLQRRDDLAGLALGLACVVKPTFVPLLIVLFVHGRWRVVVGSVVTASIVIAGSLPFVGLDAWAAWPRVALAFANRGEISVTAYQTTVGFVRHFCVADPTWNPAPPLASATALGASACAPAVSVLPLLLVGVALLVTAVVARYRRLRPVLAASVCLSLLALPIAEDHQFIALAVPIFLLTPGTRRHQWWLMAAAALWLLPESWTWARFTSGWLSLLAYPRLYATWLLWSLAVVSGPAERDGSPPVPAHRE